MKNSCCGEARFFLKAAVLIGLLLVVITPPMCTPDENAHFVNAWAISRGDLFPEVVDGRMGRYVSAQTLTFIDTYIEKTYGTFDVDYSYQENYFDSWLPDNDTTEIFYSASTVKIPFTGYLFSGIGMAFGRFVECLFRFEVNALPYNLLLYGRLGNLAFYIAVIYWALRITPHFKRVMLVLALMPMSIFLGASVNYDAVLIPVSFLLISAVLSMLEHPEAPLKKGEVLCVLICTFFLVGVKQAYAPLLLLLTAVPLQKYGGRKTLYRCVGAVMVTGVIACLPLLISNRIAGRAIDENAAVVLAQNTFIKEHLGLMPRIIAATLKRYLPFYTVSFWGCLGQLDTNFPVPFTVIFYMVLAFLSVVECGTAAVWRTQRWKRLLPLVSVSVSFIGIFMAIYSTWTPLPGIADGVGTLYVSGVQGRYFIPLFLPGLLIFSNGVLRRKKFTPNIEEHVAQIAKYCAACCGALTVLTVYLRYW